MDKSLGNVSISNRSSRSCAVVSGGMGQRVSYALAGIFSLFGAALLAGVSKWLVLLSIIVGVNQLLMAAVGWCPISKLLDIVLRRTASETA